MAWSVVALWSQRDGISPQDHKVARPVLPSAGQLVMEKMGKHHWVWFSAMIPKGKWLGSWRFNQRWIPRKRGGSVSPLVVGGRQMFTARKIHVNPHDCTGRGTIGIGFPQGQRRWRRDAEGEGRSTWAFGSSGLRVLAKWGWSRERIAFYTIHIQGLR